MATPHGVTKSVYLEQGCLKVLAKPKLSGRRDLGAEALCFAKYAIAIAHLNKDVSRDVDVLWENCEVNLVEHVKLADQ